MWHILGRTVDNREFGERTEVWIVGRLKSRQIQYKDSCEIGKKTEIWIVGRLIEDICLDSLEIEEKTEIWIVWRLERRQRSG